MVSGGKGNGIRFSRNPPLLLEGMPKKRGELSRGAKLKAN